MLLGVDVGGTFTDAVLVDREEIFTAKSPSTPRDQSEGVMNAVDAVLAQAGARPYDVERFVHGMTVGTNALLEGRTAKTALLATEGFTDIEELRRQNRAELYRLCADHPPPLVPPDLRVAVPERMGPDGVLRELDEDELRSRLRELPDDCAAVAVCLLWGFLHREHEERVAKLVAEALPDAHVSTSHETAAVFREYERLATTVVDAAVSPLLRRYLDQLQRRAGDKGLPRPEIMLSTGGVADLRRAAAHGSWTVLSGPAGGAVGAAWLAVRTRVGQGVCVDMGGTSCDVSLARKGQPVTTGRREVGGRPLALPMVDVHTVGAGGGSIGWRDSGGALRVGPQSAGAEPGPAAYGRGGTEPTVTDANLVLGYLDAESPLAGGVELDRAAAEKAIDRLAGSIGMTREETAGGILRIAAIEMARAVRVVTVERGLDPRDYPLLAFGGAGPLHAAAIADELEMTRIVVPYSSGVLSALGMVVSGRRRDLVESVLLSGESFTREAVGEITRRLIAQGQRELGLSLSSFEVHYDLRYAGQAFELTVRHRPSAEPDELRSAFDLAHTDRYGFRDTDADLELVTIRVAVFGGGATLETVPEPPAAEDAGTRTTAMGETRIVHGPPGDVDGPAIVELPGATVVVPPDWHAERAEGGALVMERSG